MKPLLCFLAFAASLAAADPAVIEKGRAEERRACVACHSLRIIHIQRLNRVQWDREIAKMVGWGTAVKEREALLEYLVDGYGDDKPTAPLARSTDGVKKP
jgi:hypothetical protein